MEKLSALEAAFLELENDTQPLHLGVLLLLEGPAPDHRALRDHVASCVDVVPALRRRVQRMPFYVGRPVWTDSLPFVIEDHVRHTILDEPGAESGLRDLMVRVMGRRLDVTRPLWEIWQVDNLSANRWAVLLKAHHSLVDGVAGVSLLEALLAGGHGARAPVPSGEPRPVPSGLGLLAEGASWVITLPFRCGHLLGRATSSPRETVGRIHEVRRGVAQVVRPDLPPSVLGGPLGPGRRWGWTRTDLAELAEVRSATGCTVNDVFLAGLTGGYRTYLLARGESLDRLALRAIVPVSQRSPGPPGRPGPTGNRVSAMFLELPVTASDPTERLALVVRRMAEQKAQGVSTSTDAVVSLADHVPAPLLARAARWYARTGQRRVNVAATNVIGPSEPRSLIGRPLLELAPYVPLAQEVRTAAALVSYAGGLTIGITSDSDAVPDLDHLVDAVRQSLLELVAAYRTG